MAVFDFLPGSHTSGDKNEQNTASDAAHTSSSLLGKVTSSIGSTVSSATHKVSSTVSNTVANIRSRSNDRQGVWDGASAEDRHAMDELVGSRVTAALGGSTKNFADHTGMTGKILITAVDWAAGQQTDTISSYVDWIRSRRPESSPEQVQRVINKHFSLIASGSGAGAGLASAVPGVGLVTGTAAIGIESLVFLESAAFYTLASAYLRGADISAPERRRGLILITLLGSQGSALVDATIGEITGAAGARAGSLTAANALAKLAPNGVREVNKRLTKVAVKTVTKKFLPAAAGKLMPLGIGAVIGWGTSKALAKNVISHAEKALGAVPQRFSTPTPDVAEPPQVIKDLASKTGVNLDNELDA